MLDLSATVKKHVDPSAPVPLRMMAAKALVPLPPPDMITALFVLTSDPDEKVRATAVESAGQVAGPHPQLGAAGRGGGPCGPRLVPRPAGEAGRLRRDAGPQRLHAGRRGVPCGLVLQRAHRGDHQPEPAASPSPRGGRPAAVPQPELRSGAHRRGLRLLRPLGPGPRRRPADACGTGAHLRARRPRPRRRMRGPRPTRSSRSTPSSRTRMRLRSTRASGSPWPSGS